MRLIYFFTSILFTYGCKTDNQIKRDDDNLPNIILCMADDQGWGDMAYNGHPVLQTPHFDAMAEEVLRFDHFYAAAPVCSPTRGSVMTGRHPNRFGCFTWGRTLRPQEVTIAEVLKKAGYVTGHFGKWHLGSVRQGSPVNPGNSGFDVWFSAPNFFDNEAVMSREGVAVQTTGESSIMTMDTALAFIQKYADQDRPYLAVIWFGSPHQPHRAVKEDLAKYADQPENLQHFYGEISGMDQAVGKLRTTLKTLPDYENTILWYCSDNGGLPRVGSTGGRGHKGQIYEGGLRVPALLQWPSKIKEHHVTGLPTNTSDILPTLLDITGITLEHLYPLDGISLLSLIENNIEVRPQPMGFWNFPAPGIRTPSLEWMKELLQAQSGGNMVGDSSRLRLDAGDIPTYSEDSLLGHSAWLDWPWKLHRIERDTGSLKFELYNLEKDPNETNDLFGSELKQIGRLQTALEAWQKSVLKSLNGADYTIRD